MKKIMKLVISRLFKFIRNVALIAWLAFLLSIYNLYIDHQHIDPEIRVKLHMVDGPIQFPEELSIYNTGRVEVTDLMIRFVVYLYDPESGQLDIVYDDPEYLDVDGERSVLTRRLISNTTIDPNVFRFAKPLENNIVELRVEYFRESDAKVFQKRALYFIDSNGSWIPESSEFLEERPEYFDISERIDSQIFITFENDLLHDIRQ